MDSNLSTITERFKNNIGSNCHIIKIKLVFKMKNNIHENIQENLKSFLNNILCVMIINNSVIVYVIQFLLN